jgi:hypothetical protein
MERIQLKATPFQVENLEKVLGTAGTTVTKTSANEWEITGHGIKATALYTPADLMLSVDVLEKPFYVSIERIHEGITKALNANT